MSPSLQSFLNVKITALTMSYSSGDCFKGIHKVDVVNSGNKVNSDEHIFYQEQFTFDTNTVKYTEFEQISIAFDKLILRFKSYSLTHIILTLSNQPHHVLYDTGAALTDISEQLVDTLDTKKILNLISKIVLIHFNGDETAKSSSCRSTVVSNIAMILIKLDKFSIEFPFYIFPGSLSATLIGVDFLECFRSIIDIPNKKINFEIPKGASYEEVQQF